MDKWADYDRWNEAILDVVFPEVEVPEPVYLDFEEDVAEALAQRLGVSVDSVEKSLCAAVAQTIPDAGPAEIFARHVARTRWWEHEGRQGLPPFLALLAVFSIAAEQMAAEEGMAANNFFGRLRPLLGREPGDHRIDAAYRRVAERLWSAHNRWLLELDGARGLPTAFALSFRYVGLSLSQALVRHVDREKLKDFFREYGFAPGVEVAPSELELVLDAWIAQRPCPVSHNVERLWHGAARPRIAQAAAVALAGWDGSVSSRRAQGEQTTRGHLALTLELGGFPRRRFGLQALLYLPQPHQPRDATVLTASPETTVELVPDVQGALGLGRSATLHAGDVLEGVLRIRDELSGVVLERRPRRLVLFREDELTRRWVESPQVMLGESVRLLVKDDLLPRLATVLDEVARPGWEAGAARYPGQPEGWVLVTGVEVFSHPGSLVRTTAVDDLAPLVPLTSSQLKIAGGFALPGRTKGKWHSWAPPEIRAVSDAAGGFQVQLVDLRRYAPSGLGEDPATETLLEVWDDDGSGVVVAPLADYQLDDGDYRVDLVGLADGEPLASTVVRLRSAGSPDAQQWSTVAPGGYGPGLGVLGVQEDHAEVDRLVRGDVVPQATPPTLVRRAVPSRPWWATGRSQTTSRGPDDVRLTMPDADSCMYTGRHHEQVETVPTDSRGKPLVSWSHGRCSGCGLVRRYPTRLRPAWSTRPGPRTSTKPEVLRHEVTHLSPTSQSASVGWEVALDAAFHTGGGSWGQLERIALQVDNTALFVDHLARTLEVLGHLDVRRSPADLAPVGWEVAPTALAGTANGFHLAGYWPEDLYAAVRAAVQAAGATVSVVDHDAAPGSYFAEVDQAVADELVVDFDEVSVVPDAWRDLAGVLPPLSDVLAALPRQREAVAGRIRWYQPRDNSWLDVSDCEAVGGFRAVRFSTLDFVRTPTDLAAGTLARSTVQLSKHVAALLMGRPLLAHDAGTGELVVPLGADLPGLYGRAVVAASGRPPEVDRRARLLRYHSVPAELASHLYDLLSR